MKKRFIVLMIFIFIAFGFIFSKEREVKINLNKNKTNGFEDVKIRLIVDTWIYPFLFENNLNYIGLSLNGSIMCGAKLEKYNLTFGGEVAENYFTLRDSNDYYSRTAPWNILRFTANGYFEPIDWFELKWGFGGAWYSTTYTVNAQLVGRDAGGISFILASMFRPWKYLRLDLINNFDLFFGESGTIRPYYSGGVRCNFYPGLEFFSLYVETSGLLYIYDENSFYIESQDVYSGLFLWGTGISLDICLPYKFERKPRQKKIFNPEVDRLKRALEGDSVDFSNILFYPDSDKLKEESFPLVDEIADVLREREQVYFEIQGHTNFTGRPKNELILSRKRALRVKKYLAKKGISEDRMSSFGFGGYYSKGKKITEANRKIVIKIISNIEEERRKEDNFEKLRENKKDAIISFRGIYFNKKSDQLIKTALVDLDKIAVILLEKKEINIGITGYAKPSGNSNKELALCVKRAKAIKRYLASKGIEKDRIKVFSFSSKYSEIGSNRELEIKNL